MSKTTDELIRRAMENGEFKDLHNQGKKLDLDDYFDTPEDVRVGYSILKNGEFVPVEVELLREIDELKSKLGQTEKETERKALSCQIEDCRLKYNILMDQHKRFR